MELVDPSEHTLDSFTEVLHKARQVDAGRSKERGNTETRLQITSKDREAAAEIIRLLTIALEEEEEEEEEEAIGGRFKVVPVKSYAEASQEEGIAQYRSLSNFSELHYFFLHSCADRVTRPSLPYCAVSFFFFCKNYAHVYDDGRNIWINIAVLLEFFVPFLFCIYI